MALLCSLLVMAKYKNSFLSKLLKQNVFHSYLLVKCAVIFTIASLRRRSKPRKKKEFWNTNSEGVKSITV